MNTKTCATDPRHQPPYRWPSMHTGQPTSETHLAVDPGPLCPSHTLLAPTSRFSPGTRQKPILPSVVARTPYSGSGASQKRCSTAPCTTARTRPGHIRNPRRGRLNAGGPSLQRLPIEHEAHESMLSSCLFGNSRRWVCRGKQLDSSQTGHLVGQPILYSYGPSAPHMGT